MRNSIIILFLFSLLSLDLYSIEFPEKYTISYNAKRTDDYSGEPTLCRDLIDWVKTGEIELQRTSNSEYEAEYSAEKTLIADDYQTPYCDNATCTVVEILLKDGSADFNLVVGFNENTLEYTYELKMEILKEPTGGEKQNCNGTTVEYYDKTWEQVYYEVNKQLPNQVNGKIVHYTDFSKSEDGKWVYESTKEVGGLSTMEQTIKINPGTPQLLSHNIQYQKNYLEGVSFDNTLKAEVNWAGTPVSQRNATFIINGEEFSADNVSSSTVTKKIDMADPVFDGTVRGAIQFFKVRIETPNFSNTKQFSNLPYVFKSWENTDPGKYKVQKLNNYVHFNIEDFETTVELAKQNTAGVNGVNITGNPFIEGFFGFENDIPVRIQKLTFPSNGASNVSTFEADIMRRGTYNNIGITNSITGLSENYILRGSGQVASLNFNHVSVSPVTQRIKIMNELFPNGIKRLGAGPSEIKPYVTSAEAFLKNYPATIETYVTENLTGELSILNTDEFEYRDLSGKITEHFTVDEPIDVMGAGIATLTVNGKANMHLETKNKDELTSFATGTIKAHLNASVLGFWTLLGNNILPIYSAGSIPSKNSINKTPHEKVQSTEEPFLYDVGYDFMPDLAYSQGVTAVVFNEGNSLKQPSGEITYRTNIFGFWSKYFNLSTKPAYAYRPKAEFDNNNNLVTVHYAESKDMNSEIEDAGDLINELELYYSVVSFENNEIVQEGYLTDNNIPDLDHKLLKDQNGNLHLFWKTASGDAAGTADNPLVIKHKVFNGESWSENEIIADDLVNVKEWTAAVYDDGNAAVSYLQFLDKDFNRSEIYTKEKKNGKWNSSFKIFTEAKNINNIKLFYSNNNVLHTFWANDSTIKHQNMRNDNITIFTDLMNNEGGGFIDYSATMNENAAVVAVRTGNDIRISKNYDVSRKAWTAAEVIDTTSSGDIIQEINLNKNGRLDVLTLDRDTSKAPYLNAHDAYLFTNKLFKELNVEDNPYSIGVRITPNPASDYAKVELPAESNFDNVTVYDLEGNVLFEKGIKSANKIKIQTSGLPAGIYLLKIKHLKGTVTKKLIVK